MLSLLLPAAAPPGYVSKAGCVKMMAGMRCFSFTVVYPVLSLWALVIAFGFCTLRPAFFRSNCHGPSSALPRSGALSMLQGSRKVFKDEAGKRVCLKSGGMPLCSGVVYNIAFKILFTHNVTHMMARQ